MIRLWVYHANSEGDEAFVHIKASTPLHHRPSAGDLITYELQKDDKHRNDEELQYDCLGQLKTRLVFV